MRQPWRELRQAGFLAETEKKLGGEWKRSPWLTEVASETLIEKNFDASLDSERTRERLRAIDSKHTRFVASWWNTVKSVIQT